MRMKNSILIAAAMTFVVGCATVAVTGRSQLSLVTDDEVLKMANRASSKAMSSLSAKGKILKPSESADAKKTVDMVQQVANNIIDASGLRSKLNWQVTVVKSDIRNAFALPNGQIVIYTGLLPLTKTEAGLATVIGHEVAHVVARHTAERISQVLFADGLMQIASAAASQSKHRAAIDAAVGLGVQYGVLMPYSRAHESEADRIGQIYMAKAGYNPAESIAVWVRMENAHGDSQIEFTSTHPADSTRIEQLTEWLPQAQLFYDDRSRALPKSLDEIELAQRQHAQLAAAFPIGLKPDIREDYWYKFSSDDSGGEVAFRFDKMYDCQYGKCITVKDEKDEKKTITTDYRILKAEKPDGSAVMFDPPLRNIRFPVTVGDEWEDTVNIESSNGKKSVGALRTRVLGYEAVEVPAGSFMAYKVASSTGGRTIFEGWYVPETRGFVKSVSYDKKGEMSTNVMTDYQRSDDPSGMRTVAPH